jgi:hypothetical protein
VPRWNELDDLTKRIDAQRNEVASAPSEEGTKELNALLKEQTRTLEKSRKAMELEHDMKKKVEDLTFAVKKNVEDQGRKQDEIARQEVLVNTLREKLADAIRLRAGRGRLTWRSLLHASAPQRPVAPAPRGLHLGLHGHPGQAH